MKNFLIIILSALLLSGFAINAEAGFYVRKTAAETSMASSENIAANRHKREERKRHKRWERENDNAYRIQQAKISFHFALLGLILFPLGIPAIVHAVRSLKKREWYFHDMALVGIIFGSLEVLALALLITMVLFLIL